MEFSQFHFADPKWFLGLIIIPIVCFLYLFFYRSTTNTDKLEKFADKHLIPHLLRNSQIGQISVLKSIILGSTLWMLLMAAMASPRWDFKQISNFSQDNSLVILLDLSKSMDSNDIKPSRLIRARQEVEDIINLNNNAGIMSVSSKSMTSGNIKIGLVGFAANAHIISAITEDMNNIKHLLPFIGTDLIYVQGTRLAPALKTAEQMLESQPGNNKSILIISDGDSSDPEAIDIISSLAQKNIITHTLGIGTEEGARFIDDKGQFIERNGQLLISKIEKGKLQEISKAGGGEYFDSDHSDNNTTEILKAINKRNHLTEQDGVSQDGKQWDDRFYIFVFPVMLIILLWFRKGFSFPIILLVILAQAPSIQAVTLTDQLFLSKEQQAKKSLEEIEDYDTAAKLFDDSYKRGVVYYKAGDFKEAEKHFRNNTRPEVQTNALYNLGNALAMQDKLEEAVDTYQKALELDPDNPKIKSNLGIVKVMIVKVEEKKKEDKKNKPKKNDNNDFPGGGGGGGDDNDDEDENGGDGKDDCDKDKGDKDKSDKDEDKGDKGDKDKDKSDKNEGKSDKDEDKSDKGDKDKDSGSNNTDSAPGSGEEIAVDQWLDQIPNDHKNFLKNQFYLESLKQNNQTQPVLDPW